MDDRAGLGRAGEKQAERFLRRHGLKLVTRNYRCPVGEIDLIAIEKRTVVFVEVKTRRDREHADPQDAVNPPKQRKLIRTARYFLQQTGSQDRPCRFDVIAITRTPDGGMDVEHIQDAFVPGG